ncbi:hypothetical protein [Amycolatopsis sp. NPDC059021]|uniref:hypothetical protein n=1 Tax=Amycolatopsis sp. NPDC059021 TaxID=3346704 RepID=UPI00366F21E5
MPGHFERESGEAVPEGSSGTARRKPAGLAFLAALAVLGSAMSGWPLARVVLEGLAGRESRPDSPQRTYTGE